MFRWLIGSSLQFRFLVMALAGGLIAYGATHLRHMPVSVFPEFAPPIVEVQTEALGLSANEVDSLVTLNLEELLSGVPWLESIRSSSVTGLSSIIMTFARGTDVMRARQMIQERLTLAYTLPNVAKPPAILQPLSVTSRLMMVGISSDKIDPAELSLIARWTMKPALISVPGVANVAIWGQRLRQLHVQIDPQRLRDARITQEDVISATGDSLWVTPLTFLKGSTPGTGGWIDNKNQRLGVHHHQPIRTPEDMAKVPLAPVHLTMAGRTMELGDVAEVVEAHPPMIGDAFVNGTNGLMLVIEQFPGSDTMEVTRRVDKILSELSLGLPGVKMDANVFRLASYVEESSDNVTEAFVIGAILAVLVIVAFLFEWRSALVSMVSVLLSLLAAMVVLHLTGSTVNTMVIAGLIVALGVIIDDAVGDMARLMQRFREGSTGGASGLQVIYETTLQTRSAAIYATLVVILAVTPVFFMGGMSGAFFEPLARAYVLALVASTVVALTVTPALSMILLGNEPRTRAESPAAAWLRTRYGTFLQRAVERPRAILGATCAAVLLGALVWSLLGQSLLPPFKESEVVVSLSAPPGTSQAETYRITTAMSRELRGLPGVRNVSAHVGRAVTGDQVVSINSSQIWIGIDPDADHDETVASIRQTVDGYPGMEREVQSYLRNKISEALSGAAKAIVVRIYGKERETLHKLAEDVRQAMSGVNGLVDLRAEGQEEEPQVRVKVNLDAAGPVSVKPGDVRRSAATVFSGLEVGFLYEEQKIYDVVVWGAPEKRQSLTDIEDLWVERPNRTQVRLGDVADVSVVPVPTIIRHERISPYVDVVANVGGRDLGSVSRDVERSVQKVKFPLEFHPQLLGEYAERLQVERRILGVAIAAAVGIFLLLQACFRSWRLALIAFLALPASIVGAVLAVLVTGGVVSLGSIVGFFAVLGIAARNGILLISDYQHLEGRQGVPFGLDLVLRGARERLSPVLVSAAAIVAALLPMAVMGHVPGLEIAQPMAVAIIGGIVASTLFTLFVIPALYLLIGATAERQGGLDLAAT
jgi:CzcA family heavy metal efflux pump